MAVKIKYCVNWYRENRIMMNISLGYSFDRMNSKLSHFEFVGSIGNPDNVRKILSVVLT